MQAESPMKTPSETPSTDLGQLSFAEAQALLSSLDSTLPALNGACTSLTARAKHAAGAADDLEKAQSELRVLRCALLSLPLSLTNNWHCSQGACQLGIDCNDTSITRAGLV